MTWITCTAIWLGCINILWQLQHPTQACGWPGAIGLSLLIMGTSCFGFWK